jgi:glucokinase
MAGSGVGAGAVDDLVAGVDVGGTKTAVGLVDKAGSVLRSSQAPTPGQLGPTAIVDTVNRLVEELVGRAGVSVRAVGVGSAGVIDAVAGRVLSATDVLAGWAGTDLRGELERSLRVPVSVDNDVHAHALGEAWQGAAKGVESVLFVAVGTGVGASIVLGGRVWHGAHSAAGHAGHIPTSVAGTLPCTCGGTGHVEAVASGPAMLARYRELSGRPAEQLPEVVHLAAVGDEVARHVVQRGAAALGAAVGGLVNVLDPHLVVVGGGVSGAGELWWKPLRGALLGEVLPTLRATPVVAASLGHEAALVGAARLAWEALA